MMPEAHAIPKRRHTDRPESSGPHGYVESPGEIRLQAMRYIGLTLLIEGVLILTRWALLPGIESALGSSRGMSLGGGIALEGLWVGLYVVAVLAVLFARLQSRWLIRVTLALALISALLAVVRRVVGIDPQPGGHALATMLIMHTAGASMLPWSPRQAMSIGGLWALASISAVFLLEQAGTVSAAAGVFASLAVTVPGTMVAFFRSSRMRDRFTLRSLEDRFARVREELTAARQIHEGAFPSPRVSGEIRFAYEYRPMSLIGGDYVFASCDRPEDPGSPVSLVLLDVTGHGIPAALTVNRLQGELARLTAEDPAISAGEMLERLNSYVCLTMGDQSVFVTAIALRADPAQDTVQIANAGHPPLLIRRSNGLIETLGATATVLGAIDPGGYQSRSIAVDFRPGDSLIMFTDGVTEARTDQGAMFGIHGVTGVIDAERPSMATRWPELIASAVQKHHPGSPTDDTLIVEMYRVRSGGSS
ncbi:MAG: PP2C family protein-serine/threonine phosphatase [Planctomycetota bacterium]